MNLEMESYEVKPKKEYGSQICVPVPGSKSITNRALLLAAMTQGECLVKGVLFSDDSRHFLSSLINLGFEVDIEEDKHRVRVRGLGGKIPKTEAEINVGSAGTAARFLTAFLGLSQGKYTIYASPQMEKRPMKELFASLEELGSEIVYLKEEGFLPVVIGQKKDSSLFEKKGSPREVSVDITKSSQFLSALLIGAANVPDGLKIRLVGNHGMNYVTMTQKLMEDFGGKVFEEKEGNQVFYLTEPGMVYRKEQFEVEPDVSAACYFYAMSPILHRKVQVLGVHQNSSQGDLKFLNLMQRLGCQVQEDPKGLILSPQEGEFPGILADMGSFSDQTMTMAVLASYGSSESEITGVGHIRYQESDRIKGTVKELNHLGIHAEEKEDGMVIYPGTPKEGAVTTYDDHRMAMAFSLLGLKNKGIKILDPLCCRKTFEDYFTVFESID